MDIKETLLNKGKEEKEFPDDFEPSEKAKKAIEESDEESIDDFLKKRTEKLQAKDKEIKAKEESEPEDVEKTKGIVEKSLDGEKSNFSSLLTLRIEKDTLEKSKPILKDAVKENYVVALQAGIQLNSGNVDKVLDAIDFFVRNGYLVVVSAEKVETVF